MNDDTDAELLRAFAAGGGERAFAELVRRYASLVYGAALRRTGDPGMAEETAQNVFATLARRAGELTRHPALAAWLQKTAAFEALRAMEKESSRRRLMHRYSLELSTDEPADDAWQAALPFLDSAVAALPEVDRQVILLRYWQDQPFKKIAETVGGSVAACEKRAERALEKLSRILRRRGAAISAGALATALTPALTEASVAPAVLARLTSSAVMAAKTAPAASTFLATLILMKSKLLPLALLALLTLLCGTGGWVAGRSVDAGSSSMATEPVVSTASRAIAGSGSVHPAAAAHRESLRALLQAAQRDLSTGVYDPAARARAAARIAVIAHEDIRAALAYADELISAAGDSSPLASLILARWAEFDGMAACEAAIVRRDPFLGMPSLVEPVKVWASRDPQAAFDWYRVKAAAREAQQGEGQRWKPVSSLRWIMGAWSLRDMDAAVRAFSSLTDAASFEGAMTGFQEMSGQAPGRAQILDAILAKSQNPGDAWSAYRSILQRWAAHEPAALAAWLDKSGVPASYHDSLATPILAGWLREDAQAATAWWFQAPGGYPERGHRMDTLINAWTEADLFAAAEWLATQPLDATAAGSMRTLAGKIARSDPERGWDWALRIPHPQYQKEAMDQAIAAWAAVDKIAATRAVAAAPLDTQEKARLTTAINTP